MSTAFFNYFFVALAIANNVLGCGRDDTRFMVIRQAPSEFFRHIPQIAFINANIPFRVYLRPDI